MYCSRKGGRQRGKGWSKSFFLENKVVINFNFRHGAKKSGQSGHPFRSYGFFQWKSKMKEFTNVAGNVTSFAGNVNLLFPSWLSPRKSGFFQRKGRKRVKEWREVTFMKEWVKPLYIGYHQALDLPKKLFPFPRTGHLKISLGPTQFLYSKFHGLLKLIFHTNQYNGA